MALIFLTPPHMKISADFTEKSNCKVIKSTGHISANKDFSKKSTGNDNLHTMYLKNLFSEENLKDIVLKLNGEAEIFFRKSSIKNPIIHKKGSILVNRTYEAEEKDQFGNPYRKIYIRSFINISMIKVIKNFRMKQLSLRM